MKNFVLNLLKIKKKKLYINSGFFKLEHNKNIKKLFNCFETDSNKGEIRFVGGCVRKTLNNEDVDDIDLAVNITPSALQHILKVNNINFYNSGLRHGTITATLNNNKFEITSLRKDVYTDGRHAKVEFTNDWFEDASRRDFTINCIYADISGNLYDPYNGKSDLKNGVVKFIGEADKRIKEDYLRILRYIRFYLDYSNNEHDENIKKIILKNVNGITKISKERLLDELKKIFLSKNFFKISTDKFLLKLINLIFPELNDLDKFKSMSDHATDLLINRDFIFMLCLCVVDGTENAEYFVFKYNFSKIDKQRIIFLNKSYKLLYEKNFFKEENLLKIYYFYGISSVLDLINFKIFISKRIPKKLILLKKHLSQIKRPEFPVKAKNLIEKFGLKEGKDLGNKIKAIESLWIEKNFNITDEDIRKISVN